MKGVFQISESKFEVNETGGINTSLNSGALGLPVGTTTERGINATDFTTGSIRYNTDLVQYEGYDGNHWGSLGGVIDVDRDTYIRAESPKPNTDNEYFPYNILESKIDMDNIMPSMA